MNQIPKVFHSFENLDWNIPMQQYTSLKVGGNAKAFFQPKNQKQLSHFLHLNCQLKSPLPFFLLGLGSNLLIRDGGFEGVIISTKKLKNLQQDGNQIWAECGVGCAKLSQFANKQGFDNLNFLVGIPGSIGGALSMNAGCHGQEIWQNVLEVEWIDQRGKLRRMSKNEFQIDYRKVQTPKNGMFYRALFELKKQNHKPISFFLKWRKDHQPINKPNCGSVFKNPNHHLSSAEMIESLGLKGRKIGGASISHLHANFIINEKNAKASDVEDLIKLIQEKIKNQFDICLETEVVMIGKRE